MRVRVVWWQLDGSSVTVADLRRYLREQSVDAFSAVQGLRLKVWIADETAGRWGAVYLFESSEAAEQELPGRARELIGREPDLDEWFDVEATVEGVFETEQLSRRGRALEE